MFIHAYPFFDLLNVHLGQTKNCNTHNFLVFPLLELTINYRRFVYTCHFLKIYCNMICNKAPADPSR